MVHMMHSAESCPLFNDETKKNLKELSSKREEIAQKHEIKILTAVVSPLEHLILYVVDAPSQKAVERYLGEVGFAFFNNIEIRQVEFMEDVLKTL